MQILLTRGLSATASVWPNIRRAYGWIHRAAHLLTNEGGQSGDQVRAAYADLLAEMAAGQASAGTMGPAIAHFLVVRGCVAPSASWPP